MELGGKNTKTRHLLWPSLIQRLMHLSYSFNAFLVVIAKDRLNHIYLIRPPLRTYRDI
jgi:hypothetical protein